MAALTKTRHPGIYKRGDRYVITYRDRQKRQKKETCRTLAEAQELRAERIAAVKSGTHRELTKQTFGEYLPRWIDTYNGHKGGSFRNQTREGYRRIVNRYLLPYFGGFLLAEITPADVRAFGQWLHDDRTQGKLAAEARRDQLAARKGVDPSTLRVNVKPVTLADGTVSRIVTTLSAALTTAVNDGLIDRNAVRDAVIPKRDRQRAIDEGTDHEDERVKAMTEDEVTAFLNACPEPWRPFFVLLVHTGLRWSEVIALRWQDVELTGPEPVVRVTRAYVKGEYGPPKSKSSRRQVPIGPQVIEQLEAHRALTEHPNPDDLIFPSGAGTPLRHENVRRRVLIPTAQAAGLMEEPKGGGKPVPWVGFHTFRHTCATRLFSNSDDKWNPKEVQLFMGHHSVSFTLETYVHLMPANLRPAPPVGIEPPRKGNKKATTHPETDRNRPKEVGPIYPAVASKNG